MDYQIGKPGRIVVVRFSDGEDVLGGIAQICRSEDIRAACFNVVGGMKGEGSTQNPFSWLIWQVGLRKDRLSAGRERGVPRTRSSNNGDSRRQDHTGI